MNSVLLASQYVKTAPKEESHDCLCWYIICIIHDRAVKEDMWEVYSTSGYALHHD